MDCEDTLHHLPAYVDQTLDPTLADAVRVHLKACTRCQHEVELYEVVEQVLLDEPVQAVPDGFADRVMARLAQAAQPAPAARRELTWAALLAMAVGIAAALLVLLVPLGPVLMPSQGVGVQTALLRLLDGLSSALHAAPWLTTGPLAIVGAGVLLALSLTVLRWRVEPTLRQHDEFKTH